MLGSIFGLSIVILGIFSAIFYAYHTARDIENRDHMIQIARTFMEDLKSNLIHYQTGSMEIAYLDNAGTEKSSICGTIYACIPYAEIASNFDTDMTQLSQSSSDNILNLVELARIRSASNNLCKTLPVTPGAPEWIGIRSKTNGQYYQITITSEIPNGSIHGLGPNQKTLDLCKYIRKWIITVSPQKGNPQAQFRLEAYLPIPS